ncbi:phage holin family protein [Pantoea sp. Bo_2]|uniref:Phage holin family protein n=2 Tax=Erwiniaceae TaxID=1903409 RepID=A0AB34CCR4_9GAMM|nr:phage holin family protein [Pantoea sp. VH_3]KAA5946749.1 phage holin family protein [Pantoea sp. VH_25]KAA5949568.1 phage holin family protein [Pantoea sp. VH_24]KAA5957856.1 phage holin family protein [Pantoea sp. VH_16]KAA5959182.1 phage holin family protein [Pantoea sp. VH_18]KAA5977155.1 phage holin family protein [Pantoea sp. M_3]KAA5979712.1 phage holin family protein [Pantoea sp. M_4]KAA5992227.1 phage holin family protein [Pantoea sp. M_1]KAA5996368.1 phage holin family protein 
MLNTNAIICAITSMRLLTFRRGKAKHNRLMGWLAWLLAVATASVTIRVLTGEYFYTDWTEVLINLLLCMAIWRARGNVGHLVKGNKSERESNWPRPD